MAHATTPVFVNGLSERPAGSGQVKQFHRKSRTGCQPCRTRRVKVRANIPALMGETVARVQRGEPALYYTWSPSWVNDALVPGKDVVWLPTPFDSLPEGMPPIKSALVPGVVGCAGGQDPCRMALGEWNYRTVINREFLAQNPAVKKLVEEARWPRETWVSWEGALNKVGSSNRDIRKLADDWIAANQAEFDGWVEKAKAVH